MKTYDEILEKRKFYLEKYAHYFNKSQRYQHHQQKGSYHDLTKQIKSAIDYADYYADLVNILSWVLEKEQIKV